jgi:hypothetical protein
MVRGRRAGEIGRAWGERSFRSMECGRQSRERMTGAVNARYSTSTKSMQHLFVG